MIVEELKKAISEAVTTLGIEAPKVELEHPTELSHGDFSTNVALAYAKELKMKPREVAEKVVKAIQEIKIQDIEKIEIAGAGFINFYLSKEFFADTVKSINADFGKNQNLKGQKLIIEYTNTNLFKELHIGHMMSNNVGESLAHIQEFRGGEVKRDTYQGDVGLHVAKAIYGMLELKSELPKDSHEKAAFLGKAYALGSATYEENKVAEARIKELNKVIFEKTDPEINKLYAWGREVSLAHFEELYKKLGTKFDYYFFETETAPRGVALVQENLKKGIFEKSEGAVVFKGEPFGLHTRVFITTQGLPTYEAKELGLSYIKYEKYPFDRAVIITANEQNDYFKVVFKALSLIDTPLASRITHLSHGMLRLPSGKMGSRKGNVITGEGLITQVEEMVREKIKDREMSETEKETLSEIVAIGAIKYSILRQAIGGDIIFDFEKSISFEGDSGPYLQYSYVRAKSVLAKAVAEKMKANARLPEKWETTTLEKLLVRFPEVVERAGGEYQPHYITTYLTELAGVFNSWYASGKIVDEADPASPYKLALTEAFATTIKNGLWLLGIAVPERM